MRRIRPGGVEKSESCSAGLCEDAAAFARRGTHADADLLTRTIWHPTHDTDKNENWDNCFELDAGDYARYVSKNAHDRVFEVPFTVEEDIIISEDPVTGNTVQTRYTDLELDSSDYHLQTLLSLKIGRTMPEAPSVGLLNGGCK